MYNGNIRQQQVYVVGEELQASVYEPQSAVVMYQTAKQLGATSVLEEPTTGLVESIDNCKCIGCKCLETITRVASAVTGATIFTATAPI